MTAPTAAVVGAGLAGLTAAHRLARAGWTVRVYESEPDVGGRTATIRRDGFLIDTAASVAATGYSSYNALLGELGLAPSLVRTAPGVGVYRDGTIHVIRTDRLIRSLLGTRVISTASKARAVRLGADVLRAKLRGQLDYTDMRLSAPLDTEDARHYALRVLNGELEQYVCGPIVRSMLLADPDAVSKVELFSGLANIFSGDLTVLRGGVARLPRALADQLDVAVGCPVTRVAACTDHVEVDISMPGAAPQRERYDAAIIATPLPVAARINPEQPAIGLLSRRLRYTRAITVAIATRRRPSCAALLVQLPRCEDAEVAMIFLDHNKCADRAPAGRGLFSVHWEASASENAMDWSDEKIVERTLDTIDRVFPGLEDAVEFAHVTRWSHALPLTETGAYRCIDECLTALHAGDRIQYAGDYLSCAGQNTAVEFGTRAAATLLRQLTP